MFSDLGRTDSYLHMGIKIFDLELRKSKYGLDETPSNITHIYATEIEIKSAITKQDATPRRSQDVIVADIEKFRNLLRSHIERNRALAHGSILRLHTVGDKDDVAASNARLKRLAHVITILQAELVRE